MTEDAAAIDAALTDLRALSDDDLADLLKKAAQVLGETSSAVARIRAEQASRGA